MDDLNNVIQEKKKTIKKKKQQPGISPEISELKDEIVSPKEIETPKDIETSIPIVEEKKPRKPRKPKAKKEEEYNIENDIKLFLAGISQIISTIPGGEIWKLHNQEISLISRPLANILERNNLSETASKYTDYTVLLIGLSIIIVPRMIIMRETKKKYSGIKGVVKSERKEKEITGSNQQNDGGITANVDSDYSKVFSAITNY